MGMTPIQGAIKAELGETMGHRTNRYLNNHLEQDHRGIKQRTQPMGSFKSVKSARRFCRVEDGRLILDIFNPSIEALVHDNLGQEFGDEPKFTTPDGRRMVRRHKIVSRDYFNQIHHVKLLYYVTPPNGRQERLVHAFPTRYLYRFEAERLLASCKFEVQQVYANYDKSP